MVNDVVCNNTNKGRKRNKKHKTQVQQELDEMYKYKTADKDH